MLCLHQFKCQRPHESLGRSRRVRGYMGDKGVCVDGYIYYFLTQCFKCCTRSIYLKVTIDIKLINVVKESNNSYIHKLTASSMMERRWWSSSSPSLLQGHCEFINCTHTHTHMHMTLSAPPAEAACLLSCQPPPLTKPPPTVPDACISPCTASFRWPSLEQVFSMSVRSLGEQMMCITEDLAMTWAFQRGGGWGGWGVSLVSKTQPTPIFALTRFSPRTQKTSVPHPAPHQIVCSTCWLTGSCGFVRKGLKPKPNCHKITELLNYKK